MTPQSYGDKQYITVEGLDKALKLVKALLEANPDDQVLIELDDCNIYIISWAHRYSGKEGDQFVFMTETAFWDYDEWLASKTEEKPND